MELRIWHFANMPTFKYQRGVKNVEEAKRVLNAIAEYDLFLGNGEDKPYTTVGARRMARERLTKKYNIGQMVLRSYDTKLTESCGGGVPFVFDNVQGLEQRDFNSDEWEEWHDLETDHDLSEIMREEPFELEQW